jgi:hypothetical protein
MKLLDALQLDDLALAVQGLNDQIRVAGQEANRFISLDVLDRDQRHPDALIQIAQLSGDV